MPLKITQIMLTRGFGGGERLFVDLCIALAHRGVEVQAIHHRAFVKRDLLNSVPGLSTVPVSILGGWDPFARAHIARAISGFRPDAIHSHLARGAAIAGAAARDLDIPVVANLHNYAKLKYYRDVVMFVPGTEDQKRYLVENGVNSGRIRVIPHFSLMASADPPAFDQRPPGVFVSYGRLVAKKGFDVLLRALHLLIHNGIEARLVLGGDGPERANLEKLARTLGLGARVEFTGWIDDVAALLARGETFVLPSLDEPFGIVMLEAMARGRTIIATRSRGPLEVLGDDAAFLVDIGDSDSLARAMRTALSDTALSLDKARTGLALYKERYHADAVIPQFVSLYENLRSRRHVAYPA